MNTKFIRILALCMVLFFCVSMVVACSSMPNGGLVGELLEQLVGDIDQENLPEDFSQAVDSFMEQITVPEENTGTVIPMPDTDIEDTTEEDIKDVIVETDPEHTFIDGLEYLSHGNGTCTVIGIGTCTDTDIVIPRQASNGDTVVCIGSSAFSNCANLKSVSIPDSVTSIEYYAFFGCEGLTEITIPDSVISINGSFVGCRGLTSITIPKNVESITGEAICGCFNLTSVTVDADNTKYHSVDNCIVETATNTLVLGCSVSKVPDYITSIAGRAFYDCTELQSVTIPDGVTSIGECAFIGCSALTSIEIPDSVTSIGDMAFHGCWGITQSKNGVLYVDDWVVGYEGNVVSADLSDAKGIIGSAFQGCTGLSSITLPNSLTSIETFAFQNCTGLSGITIPDSVTSIGDLAFQNCTGLSSITILNSMINIDSLAFLDCSAVTEVFFAGSEQDWINCGGSTALENVTVHYYYVP